MLVRLVLILALLAHAAVLWQEAGCRLRALRVMLDGRTCALATTAAAQAPKSCCAAKAAAQSPAPKACCKAKPAAAVLAASRPAACSTSATMGCGGCKCPDKGTGDQPIPPPQPRRTLNELKIAVEWPEPLPMVCDTAAPPDTAARQAHALAPAGRAAPRALLCIWTT